MQVVGRTRNSKVPLHTPAPVPSVPDLLREMEALRLRLEGAPGWFSRPHDVLTAGALAQEVKRLCEEASRSEDEAEIGTLLALARQNIDQLHALLGLH